MGSLSVPASGPVCVDSNTVIYTVERNPTYFPLLQPLWQAAQARQVNVVGSELLLLEALVWPLRSGNAALQAVYEQTLFRAETRLLPVNQAVLREAARLRAVVPKLRTPDAIHAATALLHSCALFVTNDAEFGRVPGLNVAVLDDVLAAP